MGGVPDQVAIVERLLMLVQRVMHLPEPSLGGSSLRGFGGVFRVRMALAQREVPKNKSELRSKTSLDFLDDGIGPPAMWAFVVAVFHERDGCVGRTLRVVAFTDRHRQTRDFVISHAQPPASALRALSECRRHQD